MEGDFKREVIQANDVEKIAFEKSHANCQLYREQVFFFFLNHVICIVYWVMLMENKYIWENIH
jgi:hypothetical protein